jgi:large repetitive protein
MRTLDSSPFRLSSTITPSTRCQTNWLRASDVGGSKGVSNITLVLDDEATFFLLNGGQLKGGSWKPRNEEFNDGFPGPAPAQNNAAALSGFDTQNPNGTWQLFVQDDAGSDCGKFGGGWSIRIKAAVSD